MSGFERISKQSTNRADLPAARAFNIVQGGRDRLPHHHGDSRSLKKLPLLGKDLTNIAWTRVKMFVDDARAAGFSLPVAVAR